jgi:hypothetical protein
MEKNQINMKNPNFLKDNIFLDYFNYNNNPITNEEFIKPKLEAFDKYFIEEENNQKENNFIEKAIINGINGSQEKNIPEGIDRNINANINYNFNNNIFEKLDDGNFQKKQLFNTMNNNEDSRKKKLIMNRESAKKSRLKKKKYIENLEKEFIILKEELIKLKSSHNANNFERFNEDFYSNSLIENIIKKQATNINFNLNLNNKEKEIFELKKEEINIIGNNLEKNEEFVNNFINKQKNVIPYLLVKQINIMTPIRIKAFQNKFLKLQSFEIDDSIEVIKNKINMNLNIITELYGIETGNNISNLNIFNNKKSIAIQLYEFYNDVKSLINKFEIIFNNIDN